MGTVAGSPHGTHRARLQLFVYLIFFFTILVIITFNAITKYSHVTIQRITALADLNLPIQIQQAYFDDSNRKHFALIRVSEDHIAYYYNHDIAINRLQPLLKTLQDAINAGYKIPSGDYYINLRDGINQTHPTQVLGFAAHKELVNSKQVILIPDPEALKGYSSLFKQIDKGIRQHPWASKQSKVFWRGATTGSHTTSDLFNNFPRAQFLTATRGQDYIDACFTLHTKNLDVVTKKYFDENFPVCANVSKTDSLHYKYLIDIDGNASSYSRMAWILYSNSLVFKHQSDYVQWYYPGLKPLIHYLPVASDFKNLAKCYAWAEAHPQDAQSISKNARKFAKETFKRKAILEAVVAAFNAYS